MKMNKRIMYAALGGVLIVNLYLGAQLYLHSAEADSREDVYRNMETFTRVLEIVRRNYVDESKINYDELIDSALKGMLGRLDPHSEYMDAKRFQAMQSDTRGEFGGVGVVVSIRNNLLTIVAAMDDTPGALAGLVAGDQILKIEGKAADRLSLEEAVGQMRGKAGTKVTFTVRHPSTDEIRDVTIMRAVIKVQTVRDLTGGGNYQLLTNKIGYVRLASFGDQTSTELEAALVKLDQMGAKALVLDLRDNPGGLLDQSVWVSEKFLPKGQLVVSTEGRHAADLEKHSADSKVKVREYPVTILVNGGSASASEIVAGCLQDLKRATLVGQKTYGKGSVQSILPLQNGAALRLTTAKYYTPSHRVIHENGIMPDHVVEMTGDQMRDLMLKRSPGGLESLPEVDRKRVAAARDTQLDKALEVLSAKLTPPAKPATP